MSRSDRERGEGFQLTPMSVVAVLSAVAVSTASERVEGFQLSGSLAVAVASVVAVTASERGEGFRLTGSAAEDSLPMPEMSRI